MIPNWIEQRASITPNRCALTYNNQSWTFEELHQISLQKAAALRAQGIEDNSRVAIYVTSSAELIHLLMGCMQLQVEMVLLNLRLSEAELAYQIDDAQVDAIIIEDHLTSHITNSTRQKILLSQVDGPCDRPLVAQQWQTDHTMTIMYTSGTTGNPKGVRQTVGNHVASATSSLYNSGLIEGDAWICTMPLFHISGFSMLCKSLLHGVRLDLYSSFDVKAVTKQLVEGSATRMSVVSLMLQKIVAQLESDDASVSPRFQMMLAGGGPIPQDYLKRAYRLGIKVTQTYGMTETASQTTTLANEDALRKIGSVGKALLFNEIRIDGAEKAGEIGEICIRGAHITPGYIGKYAQQSSTIDGWLYSGDLGYLDEEGYLYVADRRSDLIISGGENIYPAEIENVLITHPAVIDAGVCGVDDATWGQRPMAFVITEGQIGEQELQKHCERLLARYKLPLAIHIVDTLPRNGASKLMRRKLKELL
ncbi:o-succinylbenzoate--CoA ligase [Kurthia sibirica]|uniref:2-succinylbenzoate--CoA ligase n=1 Tax=Kurthia sibirica TaxID=202750 RepID=A0A2U3AJT9_9BACL|nr:o-succinylbenzoate--CoA ligase [Kurthia sibirica]PWI24793.1 o-succinylbenzoate--CoA ligase [Kurthia sibirica]GEK34898.1 2-succinylbenzoate--CoA ligase [Kurthia sibirica]